MAVNHQPDPHSIFYASDACRRSLEACLTNTSLIHNEWAENRLAEFNLWAAGVGASVTQRASLDARLARETEGRDVVTNLLITLNAFIKKCRTLGLQENDCGEDVEFGRGRTGETETIPAEEPIQRSFSPWSDASISDSESEKEATIPASNVLLTQAMKSTEAILDQLARLAVAIRRTGTSSRLQEADRSFDPEHHEDLQNHLVLMLLAKPSDIENKRQEIRDINVEDKSVNFGVDIAQLSMAQKHLINANLRRRNRFIYAQRHARKLAHIQTTTELESVPNFEEVNQPITGPNNALAKSRARSPPPRKAVSAGSALSITHSDNTRMTDTTASAIGTPFRFDNSAPSTLMSQVSSTGSKIKHPNPPQLKNLHSFKCPCCCLPLPATVAERHRWKLVDSILKVFFTPTFLTDLILRKHIAQDLCPYTCYLNDCPRREILYITRESWMNHVEKEHPSNPYWECFACDTAKNFFTAETFTAHVKEHRSISESHLPTLRDVCLRKTPHITSCPLCSWAEDQGENVDPKALFDHVAEHIHSFSLLSLPWAEATNVNEKLRFDLSVEKVRNWFDTSFPTMVGGEEHQPCVDVTYSTPKDDNYFNQNDYFAEISQCSQQKEFDSFESSSKSTSSLCSSFGSKTGSTLDIPGLTVTAGAGLFAGVNKAPTPLYFEIPNFRVRGFVGQEDILQKIDEALSDGSGPHHAVLQGIGGQGKTQVALEYCHRKKNNPYSAIFWVDATSQDRVEGSFHSISERIKRQTDDLADVGARVKFVLKMFTSWTVQWLMVFDNYDNPYAFPNIQDFIPRSEFGAILVTSRHPKSSAFVINPSSQFIKLPGLDESDAIALLIQQSQTKEGISAFAKKIVERLACHPLALTQAGAYIRKRKLPLSEFMDHYVRRKRIIMKSTPQFSQYRKRLDSAEEETSLNVLITWELSFRQLQSEAPEDGVEAKLLTLLAYFNEKDISEQLFAIFNANEDQMTESAKLLMWLRAFISSETDQWDSDLFGDVLERLSDSSLLQASARGLDGFYHASLHPIIKDWIRLRTDKSTSQENTCVAAMLVSQILVDSWQKQHFNLSLLTKQDIASHIVALDESYQEFFIPQSFISSNQKIFDEYKISQSWFARFLLNIGSYRLSEIINHRLNAQDPENRLFSMDNLASRYRKQGRSKEAEELEVQVMETRSRVLRLEHPSTLTSMAHPESIFWNEGGWEEAEELEVHVMETRKRVLGLEHPDTLTSMANLASTFSNQDRWKEAEKLEVHVMKTRKRVLGLEHPDTLTSMTNLALTFWSLDLKKKAIQMMSEVVQYRNKKIGPDHPDTVRSVGILHEWREQTGF